MEPRLVQAGWDGDPHSFAEQQSLTDGRIIVLGEKARRKSRKRADYLLRFARDFKIAVVEAKAKYKNPGEGMQQAKEYAEMLGLKFAYATNGEGIIEFDYTTGQETLLDAFPSPQELWSRYCQANRIDDEQIKKRLLTPYYHTYLIRLKCDNNIINPHYLQLMLKYLRNSGQLFDFARTTAGQYNVSLGRLRSAKIPIPPLNEQCSIVAYLNGLQTKLDALKRHQAETAAELDALMPSILDRAFRGEL